jgi:hypothetical protein
MVFLTFDEDGIFFWSPGIFFHVRVQVIQPTLSALLPQSSGDTPRNVSPFPQAALHTLNDNRILLHRPGALNQPRPQDFKPSI